MNRIRNLIRSKNNVFLNLLLFLFIIFNTLKITVFNIILTDSNVFTEYLYKFCFTFLLLTIVYILIFKIKYRFAFIAFYILQAIYMLVYLFYFIYFHSYIHINQIFALAEEGLGAAADLTILFSPMLLVIILDLPIFIFALMKYTKIRKAFSSGFRFKSLSIIIACVLIISSIETWNCFNKSSIVTYAKDYSAVVETQIVERYGTLVNSVVNVILNNTDLSMIKKLKYGKLIKSDGNKNTKKPNFVIIQVESMDSNIVNAKFNGEYIMPYLHSLTKKSVYYPYTLAYHMAGGTSDSEFSIINDIEPLSDYPSIELINYSYPNSFVKKLTNSSYSAVVYHGNEGNYFNRKYAFPKMGFQDYADIHKMDLKHVGWGAPDKDVFNYIKSRLKSETKPFMAYAITMSSHGPFTNAGLYYKTKQFDNEKNPIGKKYYTSMSYTDKMLGNFTKYIQKKYKNTYVLIWGDHTPAVNTDTYKQASFVDGNNYFEFVPLFILTPDKQVYSEGKIAASFLDIAQTILNASAIPYSLNSDGIDLLRWAKSNKKDINYTLVNKIPYKGTFQSRSYLFQKISTNKK